MLGKDRYKRWKKRAKKVATAAAIIYTGGAAAGALGATGSFASGMGALKGTLGTLWTGAKAAIDYSFGTNISGVTLGGGSTQYSMAQLGKAGRKVGLELGGGSTKEITATGRKVLGYFNKEDGEAETPKVASAFGYIPRTGPGGSGGEDVGGFGDWGTTIEEWMSKDNIKGTLGTAADIGALYSQYKLIKSQQDYADQIGAMSQRVEPGYYRFMNEQNRMSAILNTPRDQMRDRFSDTTLMSYGITPDLIEAETLQKRGELRREAQDYEDVSGRAAARAGMFGSGVLGAYAQQAESTMAGQDAALALAAEKTFAGQMMSLRQQYSMGQVQSIGMEEAQLARQIAGQQAASATEQGMYELLIPTLQTLGERWNPEKKDDD